MREKALCWKAPLAAFWLMLSFVAPHHHHFDGGACFVLERCALDGDWNDEHTHHAQECSLSDYTLLLYSCEISEQEEAIDRDFSQSLSPGCALCGPRQELYHFSLERLPKTCKANLRAFPPSSCEARRGPPQGLV